MQTIWLPSRRHELDNTDNTDHTDHTDHINEELIFSQLSTLDDQVGIDDLSQTCNSGLPQVV